MNCFGTLFFCSEAALEQNCYLWKETNRNEKHVIPTAWLHIINLMIRRGAGHFPFSFTHHTPLECTFFVFFFFFFYVTAVAFVEKYSVKWTEHRRQANKLCYMYTVHLNILAWFCVQMVILVTGSSCKNEHC